MKVKEGKSEIINTDEVEIIPIILTCFKYETKKREGLIEKNNEIEMEIEKIRKKFHPPKKGVKSLFLKYQPTSDVYLANLFKKNPIRYK